MEDQVEACRHDRGETCELLDSKTLQYDGVKADIFSAGITHFLLNMKLGPFRRAHLKDPYYKRLAHKDKRYFWKIFQGFPTTREFRNLFESMTAHEPMARFSLAEA